jgi:hypothetical protein
MKTPVSFVVAGLAAVALTAPAASAQSADELIASAESAGPAAVAAEATIYGFDDAGEIITLREGTNGWWCLPDTPSTPGPDPMCGDANAMEWAMAWMGGTEPPADRIGFIYMLSGGTDSSNTDPFAEGPMEGNNWITTGPHVMIMNAGDQMAGYPTDPDPDTTQPFVMWAGTPYAHLMIPVE